MAQTSTIGPVVVDLGKVRRKRIKQLKRNQGKLVVEVREAMEEVRARLGDEAEGKELVPVVFCYQKKPRRRRGLLPIPW